jgi:DNA-binding NtrC family response regulator
MQQLPNYIELPALKGARVLVVEDDAILAMELEWILREAGAQAVTLCRTVENALAALAKDGVAAAVLDVRVAREPVGPVARQLARRGIPFLFYTGQIGNDPLLETWSRCRVITKPASAKVIVSAVRDLLRNNRLQVVAGAQPPGVRHWARH